MRRNLSPQTREHAQFLYVAISLKLAGVPYESLLIRVIECRLHGHARGEGQAHGEWRPFTFAVGIGLERGNTQIFFRN